MVSGRGWERPTITHSSGSHSASGLFAWPSSPLLLDEMSHEAVAVVQALQPLRSTGLLLYTPAAKLC
jgi:hypothetical protein